MSEQPISRQLPRDGERFLPEFSGDIALEHLHRYYVAREFAKGKQVLDIACGEGYGSAILAECALSVKGVDASEEVIAYASERYQRQNLQFVKGVCSSIPLPDSSVDLIVCFETLEHHADHHEMMREFVRVIRPEGVVIISTPDKAEYSDKPKYDNPFHVKELYFDEFKELMLNYFINARFYGQRVRYGSFVGPLDKKPTFAANYRLFEGRAHKSISVPEPIFFLAVASNGKLKDLPSGVFAPEIPEFRQQISALQMEVNNRDQQVEEFHHQVAALNQQVADRDGQLVRLTQQVLEGNEKVTNLNRQVVEISGRLTILKHQIVEQGEQIIFLNQQVADRDAELVKVHHMVGDRDQQIIDRNGQLVKVHHMVGDRDKQIIDRDGQLVKVHHMVGDRDKQIIDRDKQIIDRDRHIIDRDGQLDILHQQVAERDGQMAQLHQEVTKCEEQIALLNQQVSKYVGLHNEMVASKSWRITTPMRIAAQQIRRANQMMRSLPTLIRGCGGWMNAGKKTISTFRGDGLTGVGDKLRNKMAGSGIIEIGPCDRSDSVSVDRNDYTEWVLRYDTIDDETRSNIELQVKNLMHMPLISVLMPTYNTGSDKLIEAIESIRKQIYPHWELCIADDASSNQNIRPILEKYAKEESRIKVIFREENGHISAASNSGLKLVTGEWVALLDHDDLLAEHALFCVAEAINQHPGIRLIYSDEDKIDEKGRRFQPYFKSDWNEDLFYSQNLISHLGVYRTDIIREIGGFREGFEGSQDYDLALRVIERIDPHQVHHVPRVLYHWRIHEESTAQSATAKPYAELAGEKALNEHFQRQGVAATAERLGYGYRVRYALPNSTPMVSLIIPTRNGVHLLRQCVESVLKKTNYPNYEILIVDNESDDHESLDYLASLETNSQIRVLRDEGPFNYSALNNSAVKESRGELVGLLNNDITVISPEWLSEMVSLAIQPKVGAVGARLWYPNETLQHGGVVLGIGGVGSHSHKEFPKGSYGYFGRMVLISGFSAVTGACLIIEKSIYEKVGGLNEIDLQVAFNDIDFCLRVREAGYRNVWTPYAELYHHESASRGSDEDIPEKHARFNKEIQYILQRWEGLLLHDPAYSPNLTLNYEDFSLAWPPRVKQLHES